MLRTYRYRLYPSRSQETNLWRVLDACRGLHNMARSVRPETRPDDYVTIARFEHNAKEMQNA